jgi:anti-sigma factor RsiW
MKCLEISDYLIDYVLEELNPELQIQVNEHLAICKKCQAEVQQTQGFIDNFRGTARFEPTSEVYKKIAEQVRMPKPEHRRLFGIPRNFVFAFGTFLLGIVLTRSIDLFIVNARRPSRIEARQEAPRNMPFSDTVEFYSVPAKNLARI